MARLSDDDLKKMVDDAIAQSIGHFGGKLAEMRRKAEYYYLGEAKGDLAPPEIEGRSTFVDTTVRNTILWMKPTLLKTFCGSDNVVEFQAQQEDDEDKAKLATEYINHVFYKMNPGYQIINTWFDDALLQKIGVLKVWWDDRIEETREEYKALDEVALAQLMDDKEIEPIDQKSYPDEDAQKQQEAILAQMEQRLPQAQQAAMQGDPQAIQAMQQYEAIKAQPVPMLYDVAFKRTKKAGRVCVENVPPEEFHISRQSKRIGDGPCGHSVLRTTSDLVAMGYPKAKVEMIGSDDSGAGLSIERMERQSYDDDMAYIGNNDDTTVDPSQRKVWVQEWYLQADRDGDGISEWIKVVKAGNVLLEVEECDGPPFVAITPIPLAHRFHGLSVADLAMEPQRHATNMIRAQLDNLYNSVNGRYFAVEGQVNLDDLLTNRPGGVVRVKTAGAVGPLNPSPGDQRGAEQMVMWMQDFTENSTGWTRYSQGGSSDSLNKTATGVTTITNRGDMRTDAIARQFAETGFTDLFRLIMKLVGQHQDKAVTLKIARKWVQIDPREWRNQFDLSINVGLGTGNKDQQVQHLMMLHQQQGAGLQIGITKPKNMYASAKKLTEALGFKDPDQFWTDPSAPPDPNAPPPPPPSPDPAVVKAQVDKETAQLNAQIKQAEMESAERIAQFTEQQKAATAERLAQINGEYQLLIAREKISATQEAEVTKAHVELAKTDSENMRTSAEHFAPHLAPFIEQMHKETLAPHVQQLHEELMAPVMSHIADLHRKIDASNQMETHIVRGPDGRPTHTVKRMPQQPEPGN